VLYTPTYYIIHAIYIYLYYIMYIILYILIKSLSIRVYVIYVYILFRSFIISIIAQCVMRVLLFVVYYLRRRRPKLTVGRQRILSSTDSTTRPSSDACVLPRVLVVCAPFLKRLHEPKRRWPIADRIQVAQ